MNLVLTEEDLPVIFDEYDKLARAYLERRREGNPFDFFHFNVALDNGPCVAKRWQAAAPVMNTIALLPMAIFTRAISL